MTEAQKDDIILRLDDVSKVYSGIVAVKRANLELRRGAVNVLVGENGAGKSTLMKHHRRRRTSDARPHHPGRQARILRQPRRCAERMASA